MKCSEYVKKSKGFKSLTLISEKSTVPTTTLRDWYKNKRELFDVVLMGVGQKLLNEEISKRNNEEDW